MTTAEAPPPTTKAALESHLADHDRICAEIELTHRKVESAKKRREEIIAGHNLDDDAPPELAKLVLLIDAAPSKIANLERRKADTLTAIDEAALALSEQKHELLKDIKQEWEKRSKRQ